MTEALARFGIFMRMETLKVPHGYMEASTSREVQGLHAWSQANLSILVELFLSKPSNFPPFSAID